jgi:hypothetical protein
MKHALVVRLAGAVFVLHGLAHALAGLRAAHWASSAQGGPGVTALIQIAWLIATVGFMVAGFGLLGVRFAAGNWRPAALGAALTSPVLIALGWAPEMTPGLVIDALALIAVLWVPDAPVPPKSRRDHTLRDGIVALALLYVTLVLAMRPWTTSWGSPRDVIAARLPGDELARPNSFHLNHTVTVAAPAPVVWSWLVQIGQDRGGFYSYAWLENLLGARIRNADRIVPAWQVRRTGDFIPAVHRNWMGGRYRDEAGWKVALADSNHALVLEKWGAFVLVPAGNGRTRLVARSPIGLDGYLIARPFDVLVFEPMHFTMQRKMLLGIKERAERPGGGAS